MNWTDSYNGCHHGNCTINTDKGIMLLLFMIVIITGTKCLKVEEMATIHRTHTYTHIYKAHDSQEQRPESETQETRTNPHHYQYLNSL